tara:strand:- start:190 stop:345 length:156 start_codon:yes stop_codon:yes gene_type:complete
MNIYQRLIVLTVPGIVLASVLGKVAGIAIHDHCPYTDLNSNSPVCRLFGRA